MRNVRNILDPDGTAVPEANYGPVRSKADHDRVLASYTFANNRSAEGQSSLRIERHPPQAHRPSSRLLGQLERDCIPCSNLKTHSQEKIEHTPPQNTPNWPLFVPQANNSSADQQTEAVLQAAIPLILFPLRGPAIFRAVS